MSSTPIGLGVYQPPDAEPSSTCNYTLDSALCIGQLTLAMNSCNDFGENMTLSGTLHDNVCGWLWEFDLEPGGPHLGIDDAAAVKAKAFSDGVELKSGM